MKKITVYYISDLHLEYQLDFSRAADSYNERLIDRKVEELVSSVPDTGSPLLIAGDVSRFADYEDLFFRRLKEEWRGNVISVLGNHELWNLNKSMGNNADEIIKNYRDMLNNDHVTMLENDLLIQSRDYEWHLYSEKEVLEMNDADLTEICRESHLIILGGVGYAGKNDHFNASVFLYGRTLTREEEIVRSKRFETVYCKLLKCAQYYRAVVLTHMMPSDWTDVDWNKNWAYVCGHTHRNLCIDKDGNTIKSKNKKRISSGDSDLMPYEWLIKDYNKNSENAYDYSNRCIGKDGYVVFADNQMGRKPREWFLSGICVVDNQYGPLY